MLLRREGQPPRPRQSILPGGGMVGRCAVCVCVGVGGGQCVCRGQLLLVWCKSVCGKQHESRKMLVCRVYGFFARGECPRCRHRPPQRKSQCAAQVEPSPNVVWGNGLQA